MTREFKDGEIVTAYCKNNCGFEEDFEYCEFGLTYYQTKGICPLCGSCTVYKDGSPTVEIIAYQLTDNYREFLELSEMQFRDATQENRFKELKKQFPL